MNYVSVGDMAQSYMLRKHNVQLKQTLNQLTSEVVTGVQSDIGQAVKGDFSTLSSLERSIGLLTSYDSANSEAATFLGAMQSALEVVQDHSTNVASALISAGVGENTALVSATTADAAQRFDSVIAAFNTNVSGRYLFSGAMTDTKPLASADEMLDALTVAISGMTTVEDIVAVVDSWFDAPAGSGGFMDTGYFADETPLAPIRIAEGESVSVNLTASDQVIRDVLKGFALAALVGEGRVPESVPLRAQLTNEAGERIMTVDANLTQARTSIGTAEGLIAEAQTRNSTELSSLTVARTKLIEADPYESATALEAVQTQIETLYTLTSRLSSLTLTDYL